MLTDAVETLTSHLVPVAMTRPQVWVAAICTLAIFSYVWKENPVFRLAEYVFVALATANGVVMVFDSFLKPFFRNEIAEGGHYLLLIPFAVGLLIYTRYLPGLGWLSRIPMSIWVGYGAGYVLAWSPQPLFVQLRDTFVHFYQTYPGGPRAGHFWLGATVNQVLFFVGVVGTLMYFFFTVERKGRLMRWSSSIGRWTIMLALGAAFGTAVQGRMSLLIGRIQFILGTWLGWLK
ncbi:MAG TPA: hypothetical protein VGL40_05640 [Bacillota bacterium]